jgi:phosphoglucomutase
VSALVAADAPGTPPGIDPCAGEPAPTSALVDVDALLLAYASRRPDPGIAAERVVFGTSGHRGSSFARSFNEWHVLAITQAICEVRARADVTGPVFVGIDTHALSAPAEASVLEVLVANRVPALVAPAGEFTPTPAVSLAILAYNQGRAGRLADGIVITPSHNPPEWGGIKYNPPHGGPAGTAVTQRIEARANELLARGLRGVARTALPESDAAVHHHDFMTEYVTALGAVVDLERVRASGIRLAVDPLGGAGVHYWPRIAADYRLDLTVLSHVVDPTFRFMTLDWDGRIRMDPSSLYAMHGLIAMKDRFDVAFACDTDHDRHGIVTPLGGLLPANHYLSVVCRYLLRQRPLWSASAGIGKTVVTSALLDRVAASDGRALFEVPVGFKWFVPGLVDGSLGVACEESAGATLARRVGGVWTTDKDGIALALLAGEITATLGRDLATFYRELVAELGEPFAARIEARATPAQKARLARLAPAALAGGEFGGERVLAVIDRAPGNEAPIGGLRVSTASGWFAARPSGTEDLYKIYAESFRGEAALAGLVADATRLVDAALASP